MDKRLRDVERLARGHYVDGDPGHDWVHVERVMASCRRFGGKAGADMGILLPAAMLHDLVNLGNVGLRELERRHVENG